MEAARRWEENYKKERKKTKKTQIIVKLKGDPLLTSLKKAKSKIRNRREKNQIWWERM